MDYWKLIHERRSTRDFEERPVSPELLGKIRASFSHCPPLCPALDAEWVLTEADVQSLCGAAGYGGLLIRAPHYLVLLTEQAPGAAENAGYLGAEVSLFLTDLGLAHCWLTIRDGEGVKRAFGVQSDKRVAVVIAFGYGREQGKSFKLDIRSMGDVGVVRRGENTAPKVLLNDFVYQGTWGEPAYVGDMADELDLKYAFIAASLSPSYLNRQPYRLIWDAQRVVLVSMPDATTDPWDARLGYGIVMRHFDAALIRFRPEPPQWTFGTPEQDYGLPAGCTVIAYCIA